MNGTGSAYPLRLDGTLDDPRGRWLWLVKWLLIVPHAIVLLFPWLAFSVVSIVATRSDSRVGSSS